MIKHVINRFAGWAATFLIMVTPITLVAIAAIADIKTLMDGIGLFGVIAVVAAVLSAVLVWIQARKPESRWRRLHLIVAIIFLIASLAWSSVELWPFFTTSTAQPATPEPSSGLPTTGVSNSTVPSTAETAAPSLPPTSQTLPFVEKEFTLRNGEAVDLHADEWSIQQACLLGCDVWITGTGIYGHANRTEYVILPPSVSTAPPSAAHDACLAADKWKHYINRALLAAGMRICIKGDDGKDALLTVVSTDPPRPAFADVRSVKFQAIAWRT